MKTLALSLISIVFILFTLNVVAQEENEFNDLIQIRYSENVYLNMHLVNYADDYQFKSIDTIYNQFLTVFNSVKDSIPVYSSYSIEFVNGNFLKITAAESASIYSLGKDQLFHSQTLIHKLVIKDWHYQNDVFFADLAYLNDTTIQSLINQSLEELPRRNRWCNSFHYEYINDSLKKSENYRFKINKSYVYDIIYSAQFGIINGRIANVLTSGIGYMWTVKNEDEIFIYSTVSTLSTYNSAVEKLEGASHICLGFRRKTLPWYGNIGNWFGFEFGYPLGSEMQLFENPISYKFGLVMSSGKNTWLHFDTYKIKNNKKSYLFMGIGIGF